MQNTFFSYRYVQQVAVTVAKIVMKQKRGTYDSVGIAASTFTAVGSNIPHSYQPLFEGLLNFTA